MAAPTLQQVAQGIETRLQTITGLRTNDISPGQITPPCAIVALAEFDYRATMGRGTVTLPMTVTVLTSAVMDRAGQQLLLEYASFTGTKSIIAAVEGDKTLGGIVDDCIVWNYRPLNGEEVGQVGYFGGLFGLRIACDGI